MMKVGESTKTLEKLIQENKALRENLIEVQNQLTKIHKSIDDSIVQRQNAQIENLSAVQCFKLAVKKFLAKIGFGFFRG